MYYLFNIKDNATLTAFIFGLLAISQIAIVLCYKSDSDSIFNRNNKIKLSIILSCIFSIFVSVSLIQIPYINAVFGLANLNIYH
jgi:hypothetical protein